MIFVVERRVPLPDVAHDPGRLGIVGANADEDGVAARQHADDGPRGWNGALRWLDLGQVGDGVGGAPRRLAQPTVNTDDSGRESDPHDRSSCVPRVRALLDRPKQNRGREPGANDRSNHGNA